VIEEGIGSGRWRGKGRLRQDKRNICLRKSWTYNGGKMLQVEGGEKKTVVS